MASMTIHDLDDGVLQALEAQAARKGVSAEEEARRVLGAGVEAARPETSETVGQILRRIKDEFGGLDVELERPFRNVLLHATEKNSELMRRLHVRADSSGRSTEDEATRILSVALGLREPRLADDPPLSDEEVTAQLRYIRSLGRRLPAPFDLKALSDALSDGTE